MQSTMIFIGNLPDTATRGHLEVVFREFNPISLSFVLGRPFAYVEVDSEVAESAIRAATGLFINGRQMVVKEAHFKQEPNQLNNSSLHSEARIVEGFSS